MADRILITGGSGFIGSALLELLGTTDAEIFVVTRTGSLPAEIPTNSGRVAVLRGDLREPADVARLVSEARPTLAFHLAWWAQPVEYLTSIPWNFASVCFTLALVEALIGAGCERIVCTGSCAEYALGPAILGEESATEPATLYGAAKLAAGIAALAAGAVAGATVTWARIFYLYGPREDPRRVIPRIIADARSRKAQELGPTACQLRDFLYVRDVAGALVSLASAGVHGPVNLCSGTPTTLAEIASVVQGVVSGHPLPIPVTDAPPLPPIVGDSSRLRATGWVPTMDLRSGLAETVEWWSKPDQAQPIIGHEEQRGNP